MYLVILKFWSKSGYKYGSDYLILLKELLDIHSTPDLPQRRPVFSFNLVDLVPPMSSIWLKYVSGD